jgi:UDP-N-acetyl-2-amino-2-deoxyglucuronate dehydrogenase
LVLKKYGLAIVGCGAIARIHKDAIKSIANAELTAVWSRTFSKAKGFAEESGCEAEKDLDTLVQRKDVDIVIVTTASGYHLEPAMAAIKAGKHVLVEKPLEITTQRCDEMIRAAQQAGVQLGCIFQSRFLPVNQFIYQQVKTGALGKIVLGDAYVKWYRPQAYYDQAAWRGTWGLEGGGALITQAIHQVDLLNWILGPVKWVSAQMDCFAHEKIEVEDTLVAALRFASGALGIIEATTSVYHGYPKKLEIHGDKGTMVLVDTQIETWKQQGLSDEDSQANIARFSGEDQSGTYSDPMALSYRLHQLQIEDFIKAVDTGTTPLVDGIEGRKAVELVEAVYNSAKEGKPVTL